VSPSHLDRDDRRAVIEHYATGIEQDRLDSAIGAVEFERTKQIIARHLPIAPCVVADIGGGPGRYALWLASLGYSVCHRDLVPLHVEQIAAAEDGNIDTAIGDATRLDLADDSVDAVLLLGPLYHLQRCRDRLHALGEARRIVRQGRPIFIAAISRWTARIHGVLAQQIYREFSDILDELTDVESRGIIRPLSPGSFTGYGHRPNQLAREVRAAGLELIDLVAVEGPSALLGDLTDRMHDAVDAAVVLDTARALERIPELLGVSPHLLATARRPRHDPQPNKR
jgi:SAM-dependent methyltransferase